MKKKNQKNVPLYMYLFYAFYMAYIRDFVLFSQEEGLSKQKWVLMAGNKMIYFIAFWILPFVFIPLPFWQIFIAIFSIYLIVSILSIIILLMPTDPMEDVGDDQSEIPSYAWVMEIINHNVDFSPRSWLLLYSVGGTNMNVVHYLFPHVSHIHYLGLAKILRQTAAEYNVPYREQGVGKVFGIHLRYMLELEKT